MSLARSRAEGYGCLAGVLGARKNRWCQKKKGGLRRHYKGVRDTAWGCFRFMQGRMGRKGVSAALYKKALPPRFEVALCFPLGCRPCCTVGCEASTGARTGENAVGAGAALPDACGAPLRRASKTGAARDGATVVF